MAKIAAQSKHPVSRHILLRRGFKIHSTYKSTTETTVRSTATRKPEDCRKEKVTLLLATKGSFSKVASIT